MGQQNFSSDVYSYQIWQYFTSEVQKMRNKKFLDSLRGKGYYIALVLCAVAIGVSAYLYYRGDEVPASPDVPAGVQNTDPTLPGTNPGNTTPGTDPSQPDATDPQGQKEKPKKLTRPVSGETVLEYAMDCLCYNPTTRDWRVHNGIDIAAEEGTQVLAAADGEVYAVFEDELLGTTVVIRHENDYTTRYSSLNKETKVSPGETVTSGQVIGTVGKTAMMEYAIGDHVHFSVALDGEAVDPEAFLSQN